VLICTAWPYASNVPHLGNFMHLLYGDVFMRYYRLKGCEALHVSGSDMHGTNIEYEAVRQGIPPVELAERIHRQIVDILEAFEIDMHYTTTETPTHYRFVSDVYRKAEANGYIFPQDEERAYCTQDDIFLADRFIQGTCPHCGSPNAYGNQCDDCGALLEPEQLIDPFCRLCNQKSIVFKETRNWYLDLPKLEPRLKAFLSSRRFSTNVQKFTENLLKDGLKPRAVTRDLEWGIPAPFAGAEGKVLYVWAENALGYVSATIEHFEERGDPEGWKAFWLADGDAKHIYTQGKDNIPFHTIFFPAQLLATGEPYHLPDQISATEYLNWMGGQQFSKTRGIGIFCDDALELLPSLYWRFYLCSFRPENRDLNFSWEDLDKAINGVFVNNIANLIHRVASLTHRSYGGIVPAAAVHPDIRGAIERTAASYARAVEEEAVLAPALRAVADLAVVGNEYVQREKPWEAEKPEAIASAYALVRALSVFLEPFVPSFSQRAYRVLALEDPDFRDVTDFEPREIPLGEPQRLLEKIDVGELQDAYDRRKEQKSS
jgi:methionyl-tRNA synthetase